MAKEKVKSNSVVTANWDEDKTVLTLSVLGVGDITFDMAKAAHLLNDAAAHGFEQKLRDRAAMSRDTKTGASATPQDKYDRIKSMVDHFEAGGEWNMRGGGGGKKSDAEWILEAVADIKGVEVEALRIKVAVLCETKGMKVDAYLKKLGTQKEVALKVAQLKFGDQEELVDLDELDEVEDEDGDEAEDALM